jgi:hypothetical protein
MSSKFNKISLKKYEKVRQNGICDIVHKTVTSMLLFFLIKRATIGLERAI